MVRVIHDHVVHQHEARDHGVDRESRSGARAVSDAAARRWRAGRAAAVVPQAVLIEWGAQLASPYWSPWYRGSWAAAVGITRSAEQLGLHRG
jgi:hypothetical protein